MTLEEKLIEMLSSNYAQVRLMAVEQIRDSKLTSAAILSALDKASGDQNFEVSKKAKQYLEDARRRQALMDKVTFGHEMNDDKKSFSASVYATTPGSSEQVSFTKLFDQYNKINRSNAGYREDDKSLLGHIFTLHPTTHANMMNYLNWAVILIPFIVIPIFLCDTSWAFSHFFLLIIPGIIITLLPFILWILPVQCAEPGCNGRMEKLKTRIDRYRSQFSYECKVCNKQYRQSVFDPEMRGGAHGGGGK